MFKKILIANRGEIAVRIIRTCRTEGIKTVAIFSEADRRALHVLIADKAHCIGPAPAKESYLNIDKIISIAKKENVDAIHPGYGFLSEDPRFAMAVQKAKITFIGPDAEHIKMLGDKIKAKKYVSNLGVPLLPGSKKAIQDVKQAQAIADEIGYPIIIKASAGGGGKGIRKVYKKEHLKSAFDICQKEGATYFQNKSVFIEKLIENPKHVEIQIFRDQLGNAVHLFDRDCSLQRRNQKIIEEAPCPVLSTKVREEMFKHSLNIVEAMNYVGAGTVEYILDPQSKKFFFMEVNPRIQVEHPVTEMSVGVDLVKEQIRVAKGLPLSWKQKDLRQEGHSIELRICAEDPKTFIPDPGKITLCKEPHAPFVRVDSSIYSTYYIPNEYDSLITKVIAWGKTREECIARLKTALEEMRVFGIKTNILLHKHVLRHPVFEKGSYNTQFIEKKIISKKQKDFFEFVDEHIFVIATALKLTQEKRTARTQPKHSSWRWSLR